MTILDSDIDAQVERTKKRAIPRGAISTEFTLGVSLAYNFLSTPPNLRHIHLKLTDAARISISILV